MAWRIVQQPDGRFARFSEVVDDFTNMNMTYAEALRLCLDHVGRNDALAKVQRGIDSGLDRWYEALEIIERVHGSEAVARVRRELLSE